MLGNRVFVAVDVSNLYYSIKKRYGDKKVDYRKLQDYCRKRGWVYRAVCYASEMNGKASEFFICLKAMNYEVKLKEVKQYKDNGQIVQKANCDIDIVVDIIRFAEHYDELILVSSDGDMIPVVKYCQERGIRVHVLSCAINGDLRVACDSWVEIGPSLLERINDSASNELAEATR